MKDIILFGIQGSGKGTQARMFVKRYSYYYYFEMGKIFRDLFKQNTPLAQKIKEKVNKGYLATDEEVMQLFKSKMDEIKKEFSRLPKAFLFDGVPRKIGQKKAMDKWFNDEKRDYIAVHIIISEEEAIDRLTKRKVCSACGKPFRYTYDKNTCDECGGKIEIREDETKEAILTRIGEFKKNTIPVIKEYEKEGKFIQINGEQSPERVFEELVSKLSRYVEL